MKNESTSTNHRQDNYVDNRICNKSSKDALLGLAVADALGVPVEFSIRKRLQQNPVVGMRGFGSHDVPAGTWSDDTSMTIATMQAVADKGQIDYDEIMNNFSKWLNEGEFTTDGKVFDVGGTCLRAVMKWCRGGCEPIDAGMKGERNNGNGSLMRFLPVPFYCYSKGIQGNDLVKICNEISSLTHSHEISRLGCYIYTIFMMELLRGHNLREAYENMQKADYSAYSAESIGIYSRILNNDISVLAEESIESDGYVVYTLEAALWCLLNGKDYKSTALMAVNLGRDTDTVAAVAGSMAGIVYGKESIPTEWLEVLLRREYLENLSERFDCALIRTIID